MKPISVSKDDEALREIGRELKAAELTESKIHVARKEGSSFYATMWVKQITPGTVVLYSNQTSIGGDHIYIQLRRQPDDTLQDDSGKQIHLYEYLGQP